MPNLAFHVKQAIHKAAGKYKAKHPQHHKKGKASMGMDAEYSQQSEASHAESGVVVGHPKQGKGKTKGMDSDYEESARGNSATAAGKGEKKGKSRTKGMDEEYESSYEGKARNAREQKGRALGKAGKF